MLVSFVANLGQLGRRAEKDKSVFMSFLACMWQVSCLGDGVCEGRGASSRLSLYSSVPHEATLFVRTRRLNAGSFRGLSHLGVWSLWLSGDKAQRDPGWQVADEVSEPRNEVISYVLIGVWYKRWTPGRPQGLG